jgi:AraC-like DNA-binding protein
MSAENHRVDILRDELVRRVERQAARDQGELWPRLACYRVTEPMPRTPLVYQPALCVVARGRKVAYLGSEAYTYDPLHYLALAVPLPLEAEIPDAGPDDPFLSLMLELDATTLSELLLELDDGSSGARGSRAELGIYRSPLSGELLEALVRFLRAVEDPTERRVVAPLAERELLYRLLVHEQGDVLRAVALADSRAHRVSRVLRFLQANYDRRLDIDTIAAEAAMSPSTLHHAFKEVTAESPMQYLKKIRLHNARRRMLHDGLSATQAAYDVGYNSASQFSREFRRLFGRPPSVDVREQRREHGGDAAAG